MKIPTNEIKLLFLPSNKIEWLSSVHQSRFFVFIISLYSDEFIQVSNAFDANLKEMAEQFLI